MFIKNILFIIGIICCITPVVGSPKTPIVTIKDKNVSENDLIHWQQVIKITKYLNKNYKNQMIAEQFHKFVKTNIIDAINDGEIIKKFGETQENLDKLKTNTTDVKTEFDSLYEGYTNKFFKTKEKLLQDLISYKYKKTSWEKDLKFLKKQLDLLEDNYLLWDIYLIPIHKADQSAVTYDEPSYDVYKFLPLLIDAVKHFMNMVQNMDLLDKNEEKLKNIEEPIRKKKALDSDKQWILLKDYISLMKQQKDISIKINKDLQGASSLNMAQLDKFIQDNLLNSGKTSGFTDLINGYKLIGQQYKNYGQLYGHSHELFQLINNKYILKMEDADIVKEPLQWVELQKEYVNYSNEAKTLMENLDIKNLIDQGNLNKDKDANDDDNDNNVVVDTVTTSDTNRTATSTGKTKDKTMEMANKNNNSNKSKINNYNNINIGNNNLTEEQKPSKIMMFLGTIFFVGGGVLVIRIFVKFISKKKNQVVLEVG